ncbi:MAG: hypothetical protein M3460_19050 [Actinomycetota bacterium]|nr:hypothetical protein [Actinomycetota bacterium]
MRYAFAAVSETLPAVAAGARVRSALAAALATAAYGLASSPVWQLSGAMSTVRLWAATVVSLVAIVY